MKIGIVTIVDNYNFGNRLQNYAVYRFFEKEYGIKAVTLASHSDGRWDNGGLFSDLKDKAVLALSQFPGVVEKRFSPRVNRWVNFVNWSRRIPTKHYYNSFDLPEELGDRYDMLFAGSDQIWNYSFSADRLNNYFLQFAAPEKRASLSASFGVEEIPDEWKQRYQEGLSGMKHISVREDAGARIVKELTGRDVPVLVDPVMMLDREEWLATARRPRVDCSVPYVLKYYLGDEDEKSIDRWAEQNGYRVYELMKKDDPALYSAGPGEFLELIDKAALICSDSFHCIAFSILMKKPFIVYARKGRHDNMSSRMVTLLNIFGFQNRWDALLQEEDYLNCDFGELDGRLAAERQKFRAYIAAVMGGEDSLKPQLADEKTCTGCSACANTCPVRAIEMKADAYGFFYPAVNSAVCIHCGACERICPVLNSAPHAKTQPQAYAAYSLDESVRMQSSSGGLFTEIAKTVFARGGVVYGAAYDESFRVCHRAAGSLAELDALRGAKYAQSRLGETFSEIRSRLDGGQAVLFSGTPCQVAGLKAFLKKDYENLLCVDFVCHGVPAPVAWESYVDYRAKADNGGKLPIEVNLRDKSSGWSRYRYSNTFQYADGTVHRELSTQSEYMKLFTRDYVSRASCESCRFKGYHRPSDITLGDFWGVWDVAPEMDDDRGTSVILIQSEKGKTIWNQISDRIRSQEVQLEQASQQNPSMLTASKSRENRAAVLETIRREGFGKAIPLIAPHPTFWKRVAGKLIRTLGQND